MSVYDSLFLLDGLTADEKKEIVSSLPPAVTFKKGEQIYSSANFLHALAFIVSGSAVAVTNNANRVVMKKFGPGMCFGAAAVFGETDSYVSTVAADSELEVRFITEKDLTSLFNKYPQTAINYITFLSDRIRFLNDKLSVLSCPSTEDTVLAYLNSVSGEDGRASIPVNMTLLSKMLGVGRASLYRSLDSLENSGRIKRENNRIKVIKIEKNS